MRKYYKKGRRFFVGLISMLLIINQLSILTPAADLGSELETWAEESSYDDNSADNQQTEAEASEDEIAETEGMVEEETTIESASRTHQKNESETNEIYAGLLDEVSGDKADPEEISPAEDEDEEVQTERGPPAAELEAEEEQEDETGAEEVRAAKTVTVLTFTSDIHNTANNTAANRLDTWLDKIVDMYGGVDVMSFCGDMGGASLGESDFWTCTHSVLNVAEGKDIPNVYTTGNHEFYNGKYSTTANSMKDGYIVDDEGMEGENFRIYCLGTDNWNNNQDNYTTAQISALGNYLDSVGSDKPIIILTHYPLHYFASSSSWGGSGRQTTNADLVIDTLNDASDAGKTIVLLWGHNHTVSDTHYDEMYTPGTTIEYRNGSTKVFNFYYGAAGCMSDSEYGTGSAFVKGKGLVITIDSDKNLTFNYYDANGNNVTESPSGGDDPALGGDDETGEGVTPEDGKKYVILASDGYALTSEGDEVGYTNGSEGSEQYNYYGLSGEEYTVGEDVAPDRLLWTFTAQGDGFLIQSQDGKYLNGTYASNSTGGYDGTLKLDDTPDVWIINGASSGSTVSAHILKSTNASQSDAGDKYLTHGNGDSSVSNIFTLRSESNATSTIFYEYTDDGTFIEPDPDNPVTPTGEIRYEETDHFEAGKEYIVAVTKDDSSVYAISKGSSSVSAATLEVTAASGETPAYIKTNTSSVLWEYSSSGYLKNGSDYLYPTSSNGIMTYTSGRALSYTDGKLSYETSSSGTYYITCSSGSFGTSSSEEDAAQIRLFVKTESSVEPDDPDDPTPAEGAVYKLVNAFTDGKEYLIVSSDSAGSAYAMSNPGGSSSGASMGAVSVTVKSGDVDEDGEADLYISSDAENIVWSAGANGDGFDITNGSDYLEGKSGNVRIYDSQQYSDRYWTYTDNQLKHTGGSNTYTVYYSSGFTSTYSESTNTIYIYEKVEGAVIPDEPDDPPAPAEGDLYTETDQLEDGKEYIIAVTKDDGSVYAINNEGGSVSVLTLDLTAASGEEAATITTDKTGVVWTYTASDKYLINDGDYLYPTSSNTIRTYTSGRAIDFADGKMSFTTSSSGTYYIAFSDGAFITSSQEEEAAQIRLFVKEAGNEPDDPTPEEGDIYKLTDQFTDGKEYLIISANAEGSAYAMTNPGGSSSGASMGATAVTVKNADVDEDGEADIYVIADAENIVWKAAANADGFDITNGSDYLEGKSGNVRIYNAQQYSDRYWTYTDNQLKHVGGTNTYTVYYSSGFTSTYNESEQKIYIYEKYVEGEHDHVWDEGVVTKEAACEEAGVKTYTCSICGETKTEEIPATGHDWGDPVYTWSADNSEVTASRICRKNPAHAETETAATTKEETAATCTEAGRITYHVSFENPAFTAQEKTAEGAPAAGHTWNNGIVNRAATCTEAGEIVYTCSVCGETKIEEIPAYGHDWGYQSFTWIRNDFGYTAAAYYVCSHDPAHQQLITPEITKEVTPATCTEDGSEIYTAVISREVAPDGNGMVFIREVILSALGHNYGDPVWAWEEYSQAAATFTCQHDADHTEIVNAEITSAQGTGEDEGYTVYTARAEFEGKTYTDTKKVINQYTLTIKDGDEVLATITQDYGTEIEAPADPEKDGYKFMGWDPEIPAVMPAQDLTVTAQWLLITYELDKTSIPKLAVGETEQLTLVCSDGSAGEGTWTSSDENIAAVDENGLVTAVRYGKATIHVVMENGYEADCAVQTRFSDAAGSPDRDDPDYQYFFDAVYWAADHEPLITRGYDLKYFGVGQNCERQDFILFIYRLAGSPNVSVSGLDSTFSDVKDLSNTFRKAIAWGSQKGIINGYTSGENAGKFGVGLNITRREAMIMLYRYAGKPAPSKTALDAVKKFTDVEGKFKTSSDSYKAIAWAAGKGITNGYTSQNDTLTEYGYTVPCFGCDLPCLREQMIVFLYRFAK